MRIRLAGLERIGQDANAREGIGRRGTEWMGTELTGVIWNGRAGKNRMGW
jgi:hypothetical protein